MIVRQESDRVRLIRQTDHALLSGAMAAHWGNAAFARPAAPQRTAQAIAGHDDGWIAWEAEPRVNPDTGLPYAFTEMPLDDALVIWYRGPQRAGERDPYAGILTSRHGSYLFSGRVARSADPPEGMERIRRYLADMETLRERLEAQLARREPSAWEALLAGLEHAYRLLQITDELSLRLTTGPLREGIIKQAPYGEPAAIPSIQVRPHDDRTLTLDPWPFDAREILLPVGCVDMPNERFSDDRELRRRLATVERQLVMFRLLE